MLESEALIDSEESSSKAPEASFTESTEEAPTSYYVVIKDGQVIYAGENNGASLSAIANAETEQNDAKVTSESAASTGNV